MVEAVERADDPRIDEYRHVGNHEWLRSRGLFVAEGRLVVRRLLVSPRFPVRSILLTPAALHSFGDGFGGDAPVYVAPQDVLNGVTGFNFHRGCVALASRPDSAAIDFSSDLPGTRLLLALEGVGNPDNVGGLFRVAAAFGAAGVILDAASADPLYRKAVRTSMGAVFSVPFAMSDMWPETLRTFGERGFAVAALTPALSAQPIWEAALDGRPVVVLVGAEGPGLSDASLRAADMRVRIPIEPAVDSLNVVVAAGIALSYLTAMDR